MDTLEKGDVIIEWVELGEGYSGDYDPDDPTDKELLRFDAYIRDHEWEDDYPTYSYCTNFPASATEEQRTAGLEYLMSHLYEPMSKGEYCRGEAERLSWIELAWIEDYFDKCALCKRLALKEDLEHNGGFCPDCAVKLYAQDL